MQPLTEPRARPPKRPTPPQHGDEAELYHRYHRALLRAVAHAVSTPPELTEDACQTAWTAMLRYQPTRAALFAWLRIVAIREASRQHARAHGLRLSLR